MSQRTRSVRDSGHEFQPISDERRQAIIDEARRELPRMRAESRARIRRIKRMIAGLPPE